MITIATKYSENALLPDAILNGVQNGDIVETKDSVNVRITYLGTFNNTNGWCEKDLDYVTHKLYNQSFGYVQQVWKNRMPIGDWWHKVKMEIVSDNVLNSKVEARRVKNIKR